MRSSQVDTAVRAAAAAGVERSTRAERAMWLPALADAVELHRAELVAVAHDETHLSEARLDGEVVRAAAQLRFFVGVIEDGSYLEATLDSPDASLVPPRPDLRRMLRRSVPSRCSPRRTSRSRSRRSATTPPRRSRPDAPSS